MYSLIRSIRPLKHFITVQLAFLLLLHSELPILIFKVSELKYKKEIKQFIKSGVPQEDLIIFKFHKSAVNKDSRDIQWIKRNEFRYQNRMYDIVSSYSSEDTFYYSCIHDFKESRLFADFGKYSLDYLCRDPHRRGELNEFLNFLNYFYSFPDFISLNTLYPHFRDNSTGYPALIMDGFRRLEIPPPRFSAFPQS